MAASRRQEYEKFQQAQRKKKPNKKLSKGRFKNAYYYLQTEMFGQEKADEKLWEKFLEHGQEFTKVDLYLSKHLRRSYQCRQKACFKNAQRIAYESERFQYYEGCLRRTWGWVHHGFVLDGTTKEVVEPSWPNAVEDSAYFGVHVPTPFVVEMMLQDKGWGSLLKDWLLQE